jgi:hypothetical protein
MEVPLMVLTAVGLPVQVERMFRPGAKTSTQGPWLEKYAGVSWSVLAPTVIAFSAAAGE